MVQHVFKYNALQIHIGIQLNGFVVDKTKSALQTHILMDTCVFLIQINAHMEHSGMDYIASQTQLSVQWELIGMKFLANYSKAYAEQV